MGLSVGSIGARLSHARAFRAGIGVPIGEFENLSRSIIVLTKDRLARICRKLRVQSHRY